MDADRQKLTAQMLRDQFREAYKARTDPQAIEKYGKNALANKEHYLFARSQVARNPWMAPSLAVATPGYYAAKKLGLMDSDEYTSDASLSQMASGLRGVWDGLTR